MDSPSDIKKRIICQILYHGLMILMALYGRRVMRTNNSHAKRNHDEASSNDNLVNKILDLA